MTDDEQGRHAMLHGMLKTLTDQAPVFRNFLRKRISDDGAAEDLYSSPFSAHWNKEY